MAKDSMKLPKHRDHEAVINGVSHFAVECGVTRTAEDRVVALQLMLSLQRFGLCIVRREDAAEIDRIRPSEFRRKGALPWEVV